MTSARGACLALTGPGHAPPVAATASLLRGSGVDDQQTGRLADGLRAVVRDALGSPALDVVDLQPLSGGASSRLWSFAVPGHGRYVVRMAPPTPGRVPMTVEAAAMEAARRAGVPVPAVLQVSDRGDLLGSPFLVMEHVPGEARPSRIRRAAHLAEARRHFASDCGMVLGALARVGPTSLPGWEPVDQLDHYRAVLDRLGAEVPAFEWAFRVLRPQRPPSRPPVLVHGDFRLGNLLVDETGLQTVLDWELVHMGDPVEDLGWLCAKVWRFGGQAPVGGIGDGHELLLAFEEACGLRVEPHELAWWVAFSALKWGIICLVQAGRHLGGSESSVELAAIGRRVAETELDLLEALA